MSFNGLVKFSVITVWLLLMGWLIRFEAFPHWFDSTMQGYREMSKNLPALRDSWMKVVSKGEHVGYINSSIEMLEVEGEEQLKLSTQILMRVFFQEQLQLMRLSNDVHLDARQDLLGSLSTFSLGPFSGELILEPIPESDKFTMSVRFNEMKFKRQIQLPPGAVLSSPFMDAGLRSVKVGRTVKIRSMDPFSPSGDLRTVEITGLSTEERQLPGEERKVKVTTVSMKMGDMEVKAEVDEFGRIIRQETPFGLTFVLSDANEAMKIPRGQGFDPVQLLSGSSLPSFLKLPVNL